MPRVARCNIKNDSKIYHVILKGINGQDIFFDGFDKDRFIRQIKISKKVYDFDVYAYALMSNHVHLLVSDNTDNLSNIMHRICTTYAIYFNNKYERKGHLFQNRFRSKNVIGERYLLSLQRYIHNNPPKEGLGKIDEYKWSSYREYIDIEDLAKTDFILNIFDEEKCKAIKAFVEYNKRMCEEDYSIKEFEILSKLTDEEAVFEIKKVLGISNLMSIQNFNNKLKFEYIKDISKIQGITTGQIARILGISKRSVQRVVNGK